MRVTALRVPRAAIAMATVLMLAQAAAAQHAAFRVKGRVVTERGDPVPRADVQLEAFYGYAAGTFAGPRTYSTTTNAKGEWNVGALQPGIWLFEVFAPDALPEIVVVPIRILTTVSMGTSGMALTWDLVLKPQRASDDARGTMLTEAVPIARDKQVEKVREILSRVPDDADADFLASAARIALVARDTALARPLFMRALERDPSSYRAAMGIASLFLLARDFDSASRAFDATRNRTHDKDEQKWLSAVIGDLATIKIR
jgi:hypothetical protein